MGKTVLLAALLALVGLAAAFLGLTSGGQKLVADVLGRESLAVEKPYDPDERVSDEVVAAQRAALAVNTEGAGFGPQSPRDLEDAGGRNTRAFGTSPSHQQMNLCNIHFHENAEHRGGQFTTFKGNGNGRGADTGFIYNGSLTDAERAPLERLVGKGKYGDLVPGDTIEIHFVHSSGAVSPGPGLGSCVSPSIGNVHLRVETVVAVLVNDPGAADFLSMARVEEIGGYHQAPGLPNDLGEPIVYGGSTTGPGYNEKGSPFHVTWSVRPMVVKLDIHSVAAWLDGNVFEETAAHGVRNLVRNPDLLSPIGN